MKWLWHDVRFGLRTILKDRGFSLTAVLAWRPRFEQQRHEIGIRLVLGATGDMRALALTTVLRFIFMGVVVGLALAFLASRVLASQIGGVSW